MNGNSGLSGLSALQKGGGGGDTTAPSVVITMSDYALKIGDTATVTFTFSEEVLNFTVADVTAPNGVLSGFTVTANPLIYTATFTPTVSVTDATNVITVGTGWTDAAGNPPAGATNSDNYAVDTTAPSVVITVDETDPTVANPITFRFTFSEAVTDFVTGDIVIANGAKVAFATVSSSVYTQTVTPNAGATVTADVAAGVCTDTAGNANTIALQVSVISKVLLWDDFTDTRAAGSVDGTPATPGPGGNRTVVDTTGSKLSVGSGVATIAGATANSNPLIVYAGLYTFAVGEVLVGYVTTPSAINNEWLFGVSSTPNGLNLTTRVYSYNGGFQYWNNGARIVAASEVSTGYYFALVFRSAGAFMFVKGGAFTYWTLLWFAPTGNSTGYIALSAWAGSQSYNFDKIRLFASGASVRPLVSDSFNRADGAIGTSDGAGSEETALATPAWVGANAAIVSNKAVITPTEGSDVITNGAFDTDANWTKGTNWVIDAGDSNLASITPPGAISNLSQAALTVGLWYKLTFTISAWVAGNVNIIMGSGWQPGHGRGAAGTFYEYGRAVSDTTLYFQASATADLSLDNVLAKPLTLSTLFSSVEVSSQNVLASVDIVRPEVGQMPGIVVCLDSTVSPANFILVYFWSTSIRIDKCVAGVYTMVMTNAYTYSSGAKLVVIKSGNSVTAYYNNIKIGSTQTVSDAGIVSNTKHGLFSPAAAPTFENFTVWAVGAGQEYETIFNKYVT